MTDELYQTLELTKNASPEEIQKAYRRLARKYHPDMNREKPDEAKKKFQRIQEAYDTLNDPEKRKFYDQFGVSPDQAGTAGGQGPHQWSFGGGGGGGGSRGPFSGRSGMSLDEVLQMFAGGAGASGMNGMNFGTEYDFSQYGPRAGSPRGRGKPTVKGADIETAVTVPFAVAIRGGSVEIRVKRSNGMNETLSVKIPAGIEEGKKIRLNGQGESVPSGKPGNLLVTVNISEHPFFSRRGDALYVRLPITLQEAVFGTKVDVPTPKGSVALKIPAGSTTGTKLRMKGFGVKKGKASELGDLFAELVVVLPQNWSDEEKALLQKIKSQPEKPIRDGLTWA